MSIATASIIYMVIFCIGVMVVSILCMSPPPADKFWDDEL